MGSPWAAGALAHRARWTGERTGVALAGKRIEQRGRQQRGPVWSQPGSGLYASEDLPRAAPPNPEHVAAHQGKHVSLCWWSPALALFSSLSSALSPPHPLPSDPPSLPHRALGEESLPLLTVSSCLSASHTSGHCLGQPGLLKAEKVGRDGSHCSHVLSGAVANWQQATGSRCLGGQRQARPPPAAHN